MIKFSSWFSGLLLFTILPCVAFAQNGTWTWMHGSNTIDPIGNFGIMGVPSPTNDPPSLYEACEWTDQQGNFWIFGGTSNVSSVVKEFSALWKFDPLANEWTWMKGPNIPLQSGIYGIQGIPSPSNCPGARAWGVATWVDLAGNLWLLGGYGYDAVGALGQMNDLWKYDIATNCWTWMKGPNTINQFATYGTLQVPASSNLPASIQETNGSWTSNTGELWLFGGKSFTSYYGVMWKYDIATNNWTWMSGSNSNTAVNYGSMNVPSPTNTPGGRMVFGKWKDSQGNFWIFGGRASNGGSFSDVWMYNPITNIWTWMGGSAILNDVGTFQTQCQELTDYPRGRFENRTCWTDECGLFWQFGGANSWATEHSLNDLYVLNPISGKFTWIGGTNLLNQPGNYGTIFVPSSANYPASAMGGVGFVDSNGDFWMFGGYKYQSFSNGRLNAMWKYQRDPLCRGISVLNANFNSSSTGLCSPVTVNFSPITNPFYQYSWNFGDPSTLADTSDLSNPNYTYALPGTYTITLIVSSLEACSIPDTATSTIVVSAPMVAAISSNDLSCNSVCNGTSLANVSGGMGPYSYLWSNSQTMSNATSLCAGNYSVTVTDVGGCITTQSVIITEPLPIVASTSSSPTACNTSTGSATVIASGGTGTLSYNWAPSGGTGATANNLASGMYSVTITDSNGCTETVTTNISSFGEPTTNVQSSSNVNCFGLANGSAIINAIGNGPFTYSWAPSGGNADSATNLSAQTYSVIVTDAGGCTTIQTVTITEPAQLITTTSFDTARCGNNNGNASVNVTGGTSPYLYLWNNSQSTSTAINLAGGIYTVTITDSNGCIIIDTVFVASTVAPTVTLQSSSNVSCFGGSDGTASVNVTGGQSPYSFFWSPSGQTNSNPTNLTAGPYSVTVTGSDGCAQTQAVIITEPSAIQITVTATDENCGNADGSANANVIGGTPGYTYLWSNSGTTSTINNLLAGNYSVTVTDANGCSTFSIATIGSSSNPIANAGVSVTITMGESTQLNGNGGVSYNWSPTNNLNCSTCQNPIASPTVTTTYTLEVTDSLGCSATDTVTVFVDIACGDVFVPNAFSPNGDQANDVLFARGNCIKYLQFEVFNRWGEKVFFSTDTSVGWDGTWRGKECEAAVFTYTLRATMFDGKLVEKQGNISLVK